MLLLLCIHLDTYLPIMFTVIGFQWLHVTIYVLLITTGAYHIAYAAGCRNVAWARTQRWTWWSDVCLECIIYIIYIIVMLLTYTTYIYRDYVLIFIVVPSCVLVSACGVVQQASTHTQRDIVLHWGNCNRLVTNLNKHKVLLNCAHHRIINNIDWFALFLVLCTLLCYKRDKV